MSTKVLVENLNVSGGLGAQGVKWMIFGIGGEFQPKSPEPAWSYLGPGSVSTLKSLIFWCKFKIVYKMY
jgi:hypothetical protein